MIFYIKKAEVLEELDQPDYTNAVDALQVAKVQLDITANILKSVKVGAFIEIAVDEVKFVLLLDIEFHTWLANFDGEIKGIP